MHMEYIFLAHLFIVFIVLVKCQKTQCIAMSPWTVFALAVMEYAVGVSKFGKNPMTLLVHQY